jgi:hypothetical protein
MPRPTNPVITFLLLTCLLLAHAPASLARRRTVPVAASFSTAVPANRQSLVQLQGSDAEGTSLVYATVGAPSHGALSNLDTATGYVVYTPTTGYTGSDSFTYTVTSGGQTSSAGTVAITVTTQKTTVTDTLTDASGNPRSGKVTFILTQAVTTPAGITPVGSSVTAALNSSGTFTVQLYPSRSMSPAAYYQVWFADGATLNRELLGVYDIPAATTVVSLAAYKVTDTNLAARYTFASLAGLEALTTAVSSATFSSLLSTSSDGKLQLYSSSTGKLGDSAVTEGASTVTIAKNAAVTGNLSVSGTISGNGAGITGLTGATGGVANTGSTTVGADTDANTSGVIDFQIGGVTKLRLENDGTLSGSALDSIKDCKAARGCFRASDYGAVGYLTTDAATTCASGTDSASAINDAIDAAVTWGQANTGSVVVKLPVGVVCSKRAVQTSRNGRAQIMLPELAMGTRKVYLKLESELDAASPQPFQTPGVGAATMIYSTLTGQTYSGVTGTPCILGGPDPVNGTAYTDWTWMTFHIKNVAIRTAANPSVCGLNLTNVNHAIVENFRADADGVSGLPAEYTYPTNPHAGALLMPLNNTDGMDYRGSNMAAGWYGCLPVSELVDSEGPLFAYQCKVAFPVQTWMPPGAGAAGGWYHAPMLKHLIAVKQSYIFAAIDPASGVTAIEGLAGTFRTHLKVGLLDIEDATTGSYVPVAHVNDPENRLGGEVPYHRVITNDGNTAGPLTVVGARNLRMLDLARPFVGESNTVLYYDHLNGPAGQALTARFAKVNQGAKPTLPGTSGVETYTSFATASGGGASGSGAGDNLNLWETNSSAGVISVVARFNTAAGGIGLAWRGVDKDNYWTLQWVGATGVATVYKKVAASYTSVGNTTITITPGKYYTIEVSLSGNTHTVKVNGTTVWTGSDAQFNSATQHGIWSSNTNSLFTDWRMTVFQ